MARCRKKEYFVNVNFRSRAPLWRIDEILSSVGKLDGVISSSRPESDHSDRGVRRMGVVTVRGAQAKRLAIAALATHREVFMVFELSAE